MHIIPTAIKRWTYKIEIKRDCIVIGYRLYYRDSFVGYEWLAEINEAVILSNN